MIVHFASVGDEARTVWFSICGKYRLLLEIVWSPGSVMTVIGLNPSTASHLEDDNTLRRVKGFAKGYGCGGVRMLNAFSWRSTDPQALFKVQDPIGEENTLDFLASNRTALTVAAWGANITKNPWAHYYRGHDIAKRIPNLLCFRKTNGGSPEHPLYLPPDLKPIAFSYPG